MNLYIEVKTIEQWQTVCGWTGGCSFDIGLNLIVDIDIADEIDPGGKDRCKLWLSLPEAARENCVDASGLTDCINRKKFSGVVAKNLDELGLLKSTGYTGDIIGDSFLYAYNKEALAMYGQLFPEMKFMAPDELTDKELETLAENGRDRFIYKIYGCQRLMTTAQNAGEGLSPYIIKPGSEQAARDGAALKFTGPADKENTTAQDIGAALLENVKGDQFVAEYDHTWKYSVIFNKKPVFMMDSAIARKWPNLLAAFTIEDQNETKRVLDMLNVFFRGEDISAPRGFEYARGHHARGME